MSIHHHVLFNRNAWESNPATKALRNCRWLIPPLQSEIEKQIHKEVAVVPLLDPVSAFHVRSDFRPVEGDFVGSMYSFITTVEKTLKHPKTSVLQRTLGSLTAQAVELQIPYVKEGLNES